jgi:hypothetical protein
MRTFSWRWALPLLQIALATAALVYAPSEWKARPHLIGDCTGVGRRATWPPPLLRISYALNFPALTAAYPVRFASWSDNRVFYRREPFIWLSAQDSLFFTGHRCPVVLARRDARSYARSPGQRPALKIDDYCSTGNRMRLRCRSCSPWNVLFHPQQRGSTLSANRAIRPHLGCGLILLFRMETCGHLESAHARKMGLDSQALRQARRACCGHCSAHFYCTTSLDTLSSFRNSARRADLLAAVTAATASTAAVTVRSRTLGNVGFTLAGNSSQLRLRFRRSALIRDSA